MTIIKNLLKKKIKKMKNNLYKYYPNGGDVENTVRADDDDQW